MTAAERRAAVLALRGAGKSYGAIAEALGTTRSAVAGVLSREAGYQRRPRRPRSTTYTSAGWSEERLTEPWVVWAARRRAERERDKAMTNA